MSMQNISELNNQQMLAVTHNDGSMLVLAGAGSGKTKVLTTRIAWLVKNNYANVNEILAVTFTNKASKEMLHRVGLLIHGEVTNMWIGTFHAISLRLLRKHYMEVGLSPYFQILDAQDQLNILKRLIKMANLDEDSYSARELQKFVNSYKERGIRSGDVKSDNFRQEQFAKLYIEYELICLRDGLVDFTELLLRSYELLKNNNSIRENYQNQFKHILVDEFQDTNSLQYKWLKILTNKKTQVFAVGDDDQSIYSFRGAMVSNMKSFLTDFNIKEPICLEQNYRSKPNILLAANAVIDNNSERIGKNLWTEKNGDEKIYLYEGYTEVDEAYFIADEIKILENNGIKLSDMAILYRSNAQSRNFEQLFYTKSIAYRVYGGLRFFDRQEIKHVLCYLRLILNYNDNEAFLRVVNFPARGIGAKTIENLQQFAIDQQTSLFEACQLIEGKSRHHLEKFTQLIKQMKRDTDGLTLPDIIRAVIDMSGLIGHYQEDKRGGVERIENLNELVNAVINFNESGNDENVLTSFLSYAVLESGEGQAQIYDNAVQLMTIHAAKGLEFKVVFIVGLEDGLFPHEGGLDFLKSLEEERRLMYVAITRAQEKLYLLRACSRLLWGKRQSGPISRFVNEIPNELISNISGISKIGKNSFIDYSMVSKPGSSLNNDIQIEHISNPETKISRLELLDKNMTLKIGDTIKHLKFGNGKIMRLNTDGKKITAEIFFIGLGKKTLDLKIAKIEKL